MTQRLEVWKYFETLSDCGFIGIDHTRLRSRSFWSLYADELELNKKISFPQKKFTTHPDRIDFPPTILNDLDED